ncbi:HemK2/MTQ2 family protein methyltransferase [Mycobacteroides abscessus]|uniref:HemK2/MTQ2 family protein methyltransferase n=1 Tax=Mycobacteroides abscessus TaxID=36809 RepID=UPI000C261267|nr:HemK2/MTQ2 family protein methyltransferase [Mycobacteroides abscessus]
MLIDHRADSGIHVDSGVYVPQYDSALLRESMTRFFPPAGLRVADLCTGSGYLALAAAKEGAAAVTALDMCPLAVECAQSNAQRVGADITALQGDWLRAKEFGPFDLVLANPPYVPGDRRVLLGDAVPASVGTTLAFHAGVSGRLVLDPLCTHAHELLDPHGVLLLVQSEFADVSQTVYALAATGLTAEVIAEQHVPFGPVMSARAPWLERMGRLGKGRRTERLVVIAGRRL